MKKLIHKIEFTTGRYSGIGKTSALEYAQKRVIVVKSDLENKIYKLSINENMALWTKCHFVAIDLSSVFWMKQALYITVEKFGRIDFPIKDYLKIGGAFLLVVLSIIGFMVLYFHAIYK
jgi:NADP-dependent 3-hydroxy acid dehydrogenase YdfG